MTDYITIDTDSESGGIDLDDWTTRLEESLDSIHGFGRVAVFQHYDSFVNPGLEISGTQLIPLPLAGRDALTIKSACREAPFGRGDETVVDTSVRKTWELDHAHFKLTNPRWPVFLTSLVLKASSDLGLVGVDAHPHKLLLYEEDSFFRPHKDTEKEHGMVGTLVICLPSQHTGGDVHVSFRGKKHILSTASTSAFDMSALAWYSDVTHEVKPLTSGYRLAITYNLVQSGSTLAPGRFMMNQQHRLSLAISNWPESMRRVFYPLEHKYTKSSISLKNLKGRDLAVCQSLLDVAPTSDVFLFLANMTRLQYDDEDDYYSYGGENEAHAEVYTCDGTLILGSMDFDKEDGDVLGREAFWTRAADEVEEGEFTGNESAPEGHRYHDSASFTPPALARFPLSTSDMWASAEPFFQAIMLIPRRNLTDFLSHFHVHVEHLVTEVLNDLRRRPPGPDARQNTINFLAQTVICGQDSRRLLIAPLIASAAVEIGAPALYQTAIKEAISASKGDVRGSTNFSTGLHGSGIRTRQRNPFGISEEMLSTLSLLIRESVLKNPKNPIKWEDWLGDLARLLPSLSAFDRVVTFLYRSMDGDLKQSLDDWRRGTFENWLEWRASLGWDDMEVIAKMMVSRPLSPQQQDMDWVMNRLLPVITDRGTPTFLRMFLDFTFKSPTQPHGPETKSIFQYILRKCVSKLTLQHSDLAFSSHVNQQSCGRFVELLSQCLSLSLLDPLDSLMQAGAQVLRSPGSRAIRSPLPHREFITDFLQPIVSVLAKQNTTPTPAITSFFEAALRCQLQWPEYPRELPGLSHRPRGCGVQSCSPCSSLDTFLHSATQQETTIYPGARSNHLEGHLSRKQFYYATTRGGPRNKYMTTVRKLGREIDYDLEEYCKIAKSFREYLAPLRGDYLKRLLGDDSYRDLIGDGEPVPRVEALSGQSLDGGRLAGEAWEGQHGGFKEVSLLSGQRLGGEALGGRRIGGQLIPLGGTQSAGTKRDGRHDVDGGDVKRPRTKS